MKKKSIPVLALALTGVLATGCLAACGKGGNDQGEVILPETPITEQVDINFWGWGSPAEEANYRTLVQQFMAEPGNENINVNYTCTTGDSAYLSKLEGAKTNPPDLFLLPDYEFYGYVADGMLRDISGYVTEAELATVWPEAVNLYYYNDDTLLLGKSEDAKLYGLPKDLGPFTLVYNKTLLDQQIEKNNLDKEEIYSTYLNPKNPMRFEQFRTLLKELVSGLGADQYGLSHYEVLAALYSNNADFFNAGAETSRITEKVFTDALQFAANLGIPTAQGGDGVMTPEEKQADTDGFTRFQGGNIIFSFMGPWNAADFWSLVGDKFESNILPVPYGPGADGEYGTADDGSSTAWVGSMAYCVSSNKKTNGVKAQAAMRLAKYLSMNENAQRKFYELGQQVPNIVSMAQNEYKNDTLDLLKVKDGEGNVVREKDPVDRSVWLDTIDGTSATDKIGGKTRAHYYTYSSGWYTDFTTYLGDEGLWKGDKTAVDICKAYNGILQGKLNTMREELGIA